jgi:hypothetical protein
MPIVATANITTEAQLNNAIEAADNELGNGYTFDIALANYATIDLTTALEAINVGPSTVVNIEGNGGTLDGASPTGASYDQRGLFVYSGTVNIQLLTIGNTEAIGGNATGGGGGAGLGGGLFVANDTTSGYNAGPADVTLIGVNFSGDQAIGGTSIAGVAQNRGGGGMVGAGGGVFDNVTGGGGGGGLGAGASGGRSDQYGVAGIVPDAGYGVSTENHGGLSASDNYGGGGGGGGGGDDNPTGGGGGIHIQYSLAEPGAAPTTTDVGTDADDVVNGGKAVKQSGDAITAISEILEEGGDDGFVLTGDYSPVQYSIDGLSGSIGGFGGGGGGAGSGGGDGDNLFGGAGGFGGGGGGGGNVNGALSASEIANLPSGDGGGFGGGGGASAACKVAGTGTGGFGAGNGGVNPNAPVAGGGGLGAGGDIFVQQGATLVIAGGGTAGLGTVTGGKGANNGDAFGSGIFLQGTQPLDFALAPGIKETVAAVVADQTGSLEQLGSIATSADAGVGSIGIVGSGTPELSAYNSFSGGVEIYDYGTLEIGPMGNAGYGAITFNGYAKALQLDFVPPDTVGAASFYNPIVGLSALDQINLTQIPYVTGAHAAFYPDSNSILAITSGSVNCYINLVTTPATPQSFSVIKNVADGGITVLALPVTTYAKVATESALSADIQAIDFASTLSEGTNTNYTITLAQGVTLTETAELTAIELRGSDTLTINGNGGALNGANAYAGLFVYSGNVTIENLKIENATAAGGNGSAGGGGGAGLGGGLFVASNPFGSNVTLNDVTFTGDAAIGGLGSDQISRTAEGGGGSEPVRHARHRGGGNVLLHRRHAATRRFEQCGGAASVAADRRIADGQRAVHGLRWRVADRGFAERRGDHAAVRHQRVGRRVPARWRADGGERRLDELVVRQHRAGVRRGERADADRPHHECRGVGVLCDLGWTDRRLGAASGTLNNAGVLAVFGGAGETDIDAYINDTGGIQAQSGVLGLNGGGTGNAGNLFVASNAVVRFGTMAATGTGGTFVFDGGPYISSTVVSGSTVDLSAVSGMSFGGSLTVSAGELLLGGNYPWAQSLVQSGGTLSGTGIFSVSGSSQLSGGLETGTGRTDLQDGGSISGPVAFDGGRSLENDGTLTWTGGSIALGGGDGATTNHTATLINTAGAVLEIDTDGTINSAGFPGTATVSNSGTIVSDSLGTTAVYANLFNYGVVEVSEGTLALEQGVGGTGTFLLVGPATLDFVNGAGSSNSMQFLLPGGTLESGSVGQFGPTISGFAAGDVLDAGAIAFVTGTTTVGFNAATLTVSEGAQSAAFVLSGSHAAGGFHVIGSDGHGGTEVGYS